MDHPEGAHETGDGRLGFDRRVRLKFRGTQLSSDGGLLVMRELDDPHCRSGHLNQEDQLQSNPDFPKGRCIALEFGIPELFAARVRGGHGALCTVRVARHNWSQRTPNEDSNNQVPALIVIDAPAEAV